MQKKMSRLSFNNRRFEVEIKMKKKELFWQLVKKRAEKKIHACTRFIERSFVCAKKVAGFYLRAQLSVLSFAQLRGR